MEANWHVQFRIWHVVWLVKKNRHVNWHISNWNDTYYKACDIEVTFSKKNVDVNWHSLFLRKSCNALESKLNVKWNVSNIHTTWCLKGTLWWWFLCILLLWCGGVTHLRALVGKLGPYDAFFLTLIRHKWASMKFVLH